MTKSEPTVSSKEDSKSSDERDRRKLGKIRVDASCLQAGGGGGGCPMEKFMYIIFAVLGVLYAVHISDKTRFSEVTAEYNVGWISDLFHLIDNYSPFMEALETDDELIAKLKKQKTAAADKDVIKVFTETELSRYDGSPGSPGLYIALLGSQYYGPGGGYSFFAGRDASRAYVTGKFEEEGLVSNVDGLSSGDYLGLEEWSSFYEKDYRRVGVVSGLFYDDQGSPTQHNTDLQTWTEQAHRDREQNDVEKRMFPPCNVEWSQAEGSRYWCTQKSGGITREWRGVPRKLFYPGQQPRCACVRDSGAPSIDPGAKSNRGDLDSPHVKEYPGCDPSNWECRGVRED